MKQIGNIFTISSLYLTQNIKSYKSRLKSILHYNSTFQRLHMNVDLHNMIKRLKIVGSFVFVKKILDLYSCFINYFLWEHTTAKFWFLRAIKNNIQLTYFNQNFTTQYKIHHNSNVFKMFVDSRIGVIVY